MSKALPDYENIPYCRGCKAVEAELKLVFEMNKMPLAGAFQSDATKAKNIQKYPLTWVACVRCGLVQVLEDIRDSILFGSYNYSSSTIPGMVRHFEEYAEFLKARRSNLPTRVLEIGCNDGVLLQRLPKYWERWGVDPSDVARFAALKTEDYRLVNQPLTAHLIEESGWIEHFDLITASNCLAHISDLEGALRASFNALRKGGEFWVEVHDLRSLLRGSQWDTIYHEHKAEWSEQSLVYCAERLGFEHLETKTISLHGGLIRVGFRRPLGKAQFNVVPKVPEGLGTLVDSYLRRYDHESAKSLINLQKSNLKIAAYGASGRATVYTNQLPELNFDYIVDDSPIRKGKWIPGVAVPIVDLTRLRSDPPTACLITAWNFKDDIIARSRDFKGKWMTAFQI
jgi:SAM-dependent methyltransferase